MSKAVALFDMDGTIINGDTNDLCFNEFLKLGLITSKTIDKLNDLEEEFYKGTLDIRAFYDFAIEPLMHLNITEVDDIISKIVKETILPLTMPGAKRALGFHKERGDTTVIVTSTMDYGVKHIAKELGFDYFIAGNVVIENDHLVKKVSGVIPFQQDKVVRIKELLLSLSLTLDDSYGYGDSVNDLPMLSVCTHKFAVNPNEVLRKHKDIDKLKIVSWKE